MAVEITISIPDEQIDRIVEAFNGLDNRNMSIILRDDNLNVDNYMSFSLARREGKSDEHFIVESVKEFMLVLIRAYELSEDYRRYRSDLGDIEQPSQDVPDDIIEGIV